MSRLEIRVLRPGSWSMKSVRRWEPLSRLERKVKMRKDRARNFRRWE